MNASVHRSWILGLCLAAAASAQLQPDELKRYGFSRELSQPHMAPKAGRRQVPSGDQVPKPRRRGFGGVTGAPATPPDAEPLVLKQVPGAPRLPTGASLVPGADSGPEPARYVGDVTCLGCHKNHGDDPEFSHMALSRQSVSLPPKRRGCEGCHGPGSKHFGDPNFIINPARQDPAVASRTCLDCHKMQALADPHGWFFSRHASAKLSCTTCHQVHGNTRKDMLKDQPDNLCIACHKGVARKFRMRSHHPVRAAGIRPLRSLRQGKVSCIDCHDPHGSEGHDDMMQEDGERTCAKCHPGFVGPWVFPHVSEREGGGCMACHQPHGSPNRDLLRSRGRTTCLQCHSDQVRHFPTQGCNTASCHGSVHGSNSHPLFFR